MKIISSFLQQCYLKFKTHILSERNISIIFIAAAIFITIPMLVAGAFSHPSADDYTFCFYTYKAAKSTSGIGALFAVLNGARQSVVDAYMQWSGYYTGSFLAALRPNFYNENLAFLNSLILIGGFAGGIFYAVKKLVNELWGFSKYVCSMISSVLVIVAVQLVPSASETFYWYTAGITYTLLFAGALVLIANVMAGVYKKGISNRSCVWNSILALLVAGGILPVNIPALGILSLVLLDVIFNKDLHANKALKVKATVIYIVFLAGMLVGSLSPSTFWRLNNLEGENSISLLQAVVYSVYGSTVTIVGFITPYVVIAVLVLMTITVFCMKKVSYEFKHPFLVTILAWGMIFCAYFPIYFGTGFKLQYADSRYNSVIFFHFAIWMGILTIYWTGWLYQKAGKSKRTVLTITALGAVFLLATVARQERRELWSILVMKDFATGTIQQYDSQMDARYADYLDKDKTVMTIKHPSVIPYCIYQTEPEEGTWSVTALERYYDKEKIIVE